MFCRLVGIVAVLLGTVLASSAAHAAGKHASIAFLALHASDIHGSRVITARNIGIAQAAQQDHIAVASLIHHGRIGAYEVILAKSRHTDVYRVENIVASFATPQGAAWDYNRVVHAALSRKTHFSYFSIGHVGLRASGISYTVGAGRLAVRIDIARFQAGRYRVSIETFAPRATVTASSQSSSTASLSQTVARRIQAVG